MGEKKSEVSFEGDTTLDELLAYLEDFAASVRTGRVRIEQGDKQLVLTPGTVVKLGVTAKQKKLRRSVRFELEWDASESGEAAAH